MASGPIFVDLDETLVRTDTFLEAILLFLKSNPLNIFRVLLWLLQGRARAKHKISQHVDIEIEHLPFEQPLVEYLNAQAEQKRRIILATAANEKTAQAVADHLGIFDLVIASTEDQNLKGLRKLAAIQGSHGSSNFCYAGDSSADRPIWQAAATNIHVNAPKQDVLYAETENKSELTIQSRPPIWNAFWREMRPVQYAKNLLIFVPIFTAHAYQDTASVFASLLAFVSFCLCASGVYFLNDLLDLSSDRRHKTKKSRPIASGDLPISFGILGALLLPTLAFMMAIVLLPAFYTVTLAGYFALTCLYTFLLKRFSIVDVITLAVLYTFRIVAGAAATGIVLSSWLMAFSVFLFVSLAFLKRYIELKSLTGTADLAHGRGYTIQDIETIFCMGIANFTTSVLVLALYFNSSEIIRIYQNPMVLWALCLLIMLWGNRIWLAARRGQVEVDPVVFAVKDKTSRLVGVGILIVVLIAKYTG